jgi:hypothetical protein
MPTDTTSLANHEDQYENAAVASATTVNLAAVPGDFVHITGTTTITGLGTCSGGIRKTLVFDGILTFTHNASTLILPGGANITTAAGDVAVMVSEGAGAWRCASYTPASGGVVDPSASFATSVTTPIVYGGAGVASTLLVAATSGVGGGSESVTIGVGTAGATPVAAFTPALTDLTGSLKVGTVALVAEQATMKGFYVSGTVAVAVPTIADAEADSVDVDLASALTFAPAVGDLVVAVPLEALPTDCLLNGAYVSATDHVIISFGTKEGGGGVTGANKNFKFVFIDLT